MGYGTDDSSWGVIVNDVKGLDANGRPFGIISAKDKDYNAKGDGTTDDRASIQSAIDAVSALGGGTVFVHNGTYLIGLLANAGLGGSMCGILMRDNVELRLAPNAILKVVPNNYDSYYAVLFSDVTNASLIGGQLLGDRDTHTTTMNPAYNSQWGMGLGIIGNSSFITVSGVKAKNFWGDGFYIGEGNIGNAKTNPKYPKGIILEKCVSDSNRRNGMSVIAGRDILINGCKFMNSGTTLGVYDNTTNGASPECGVDVERNGYVADATKTYATNTLFAIGDTVANNGIVYGCTVAGTTGSVPPVWSNYTVTGGGAGAFFTDGGVTWHTYGAVGVSLDNKYCQYPASYSYLPMDDVRFKGCHFYNNEGIGLNIAYSERVAVTGGCTMDSNKRGGIGLGNGGKHTITGNIIQNNGLAGNNYYSQLANGGSGGYVTLYGNGIYGGFTSGNIISNNQIYNNYNHGVNLLNGVPNNSIMNNEIENNGASGINVAFTPDTTDKDKSGTKIIGNTVIGNPDYGITLGNAIHGIISNNVVRANSLNANRAAIMVASSSYITVKGNEVLDNYDDGITISLSTYCIVNSNDVVNNSQANNFYNGILIINSSYNRITNNTVKKGTGANQPQFGIYVRSTSSYCDRNIVDSTNDYAGSGNSKDFNDTSLAGSDPTRGIALATAPAVGTFYAGETIANNTPTPNSTGTMGWIATTGGALTTGLWVTGTTYAVGAWVTNASKVYRVQTAGAGTSTTAPPAIGGTTADGYNWTLMTSPYGAVLAVLKPYGNILA